MFSQIRVLYAFVAPLGFLVALSFFFYLFIYLFIYTHCSLQRQFNFHTIINKHRLLLNSFFGEFQFIFLWIQGNPSWIRGLLPKTKSLVYVSLREHRVCFLQASTTSVGIKALTYPGLISNR